MIPNEFILPCSCSLDPQRLPSPGFAARLMSVQILERFADIPFQYTRPHKALVTTRLRSALPRGMRFGIGAIKFTHKNCGEMRALSGFK